MSKNSSSLSIQAVVFAIAVPVLLGFLVLTNQSLSFPLGSHDQNYLSSLLKGAPQVEKDSWLLPILDSGIARILPRDRSFLMVDLVRRWMGVLALLGISVWVGRSGGWVKGFWVALLGIGLLPLRQASTTLQPYAFFLVLFCWGCCLSFGRPWSKTGAAEQLGGGFLLGCSVFSAPLGFLFPLPIILRAAAQPRFRKCLEQPFWIALVGGILLSVSGVLADGTGFRGFDLGLRPETWTLSKAGQLKDLAVESITYPLLGVLTVGIFGCARGIAERGRETADLLIPALLALLLGETDTLRGSLAVPGILMLALAGFETLGKIFVARKEQILIPTLMVLATSYLLFFGGMPVMRDRQAHAREVGSLANLVVHHVPDGAPVCLFRLNPVLGYLQAILPPRDWIEVDPEIFRTSDMGERAVKAVAIRWVTEFPDRKEIWVDPKRMGEPASMGGVGENLKSELMNGLLNETFLGEFGAEVARFPIPRLEPDTRGKITTIRAPQRSED